MRFVPGFKAASAATLALILCLICIPALAGHDGAKAPKKGILLVAFGTSVPEAKVSFLDMQKQVAKDCPGVPVRWAYTSNIIRHKLQKEEGVSPDSVQTALAKMMDEGFTDVAVQSLHTIPGEEFHQKVLSVVNSFRGIPGGFHKLSVGLPMMTGPGDMEKVVDAILATTPKQRKKGEAVVLMGHGTHHAGNIYYPGLQWYLAQKDSDILVGTVEGTPSLDYVVAELKARKVKAVWLRPLMSVAGDHARNDMAGAEDDSWISVLTKAGFKVTPVIKGTAEYPAFRAIWVEHLKAALATLD
ncbi:sirohydrochlorin cobaltochelatase [Desulfocurvus sp. DL9XJH121]